MKLHTKVLLGSLLICAGAPAWSGSLQWSLETRIRAETLDGQFRAELQGSDQLLLARTLASLVAQQNSLALNIELQDSRSYHGDYGTPMSSSLVNPLDVLQAYVVYEGLPGILGTDSQSLIKVGRQTVSIGSKRQIERVNFANVIKSYTGAHIISTDGANDELHLLVVTPIRRMPNDIDSLLDNAMVFDGEQWRRKIWALHYRRATFALSQQEALSAEAFVYGLTENDTATGVTQRRALRTFGFRLYRAPAIGIWDLDIEAAWRRGSRLAESAHDLPNRDSLAVRAWMGVAQIGRTFAVKGRSRLALEYYFASGDRNPHDGNYEQYERLFGARRTDLNNTSLHGPMTPANLSAPALRFETNFGAEHDLRLKYTMPSLASATDSWSVAKLRDRSGLSGKRLGHALDTRWRYRPSNFQLELESGLSIFWFGEFAKNVAGGPQAAKALYSYVQVSYQF